MEDESKVENKMNFVISRLRAELERLRRMMGLGSELDLCWHPDESSDRHGEVKGNLIRIYNSDVEEALRTLRHEYLDHVITKEVIAPLIELINMQKKLIESMVYERKERIVERLSELMEEPSGR